MKIKKIIKELEKILNPKYMNDVYTWAQVKKALEKLTDKV